MVSQKPKYCKNFERNSHWRNLSMIMVWERYCNAFPKPEFFLFSLFIFSFLSQLIWVRLGWNFHRWFSIQKQVNWCTIDPFSLKFCTSQHSYPVPLSESVALRLLGSTLIPTLFCYVYITEFGLRGYEGQEHNLIIWNSVFCSDLPWTPSHGRRNTQRWTMTLGGGGRGGWHPLFVNNDVPLQLVCVSRVFRHPCPKPCVGLPVEPALFVFSKTARGKELGNQHWNSSVHAADSLNDECKSLRLARGVLTCWKRFDFAITRCISHIDPSPSILGTSLQRVKLWG